MADFSKLPVRDVSVRATGTLEKTDGHGYAFSTIDIEMDIALEKRADVARAERIVSKVEANCLVSNSMKTKVRIEPKITVAEEASAAPGRLPSSG